MKDEDREGVSRARVSMRAGGALLLLLLVVACREATASTLPGACASTPTATDAVVTFVWADRPDTMRVRVQGAATVRAACAFVAGTSAANIPAGRIVRGAAPSDPALPFHYLAETVVLTEAAIELCDSRLLRTPAEVEFYFRATGSSGTESAPYCPWSARPVRVD